MVGLLSPWLVGSVLQVPGAARDPDSLLSPSCVAAGHHQHRGPGRYPGGPAAVRSAEHRAILDGRVLLPRTPGRPRRQLRRQPNSHGPPVRSGPPAGVRHTVSVRPADLDAGARWIDAVVGSRFRAARHPGAAAACDRGVGGTGWRVEGVDFDPGAVEVARASGLEVRLESLESQRYPDQSFDAVTMVHLIEHTHDPVGLIHESRRILKPRGQLVILTPNARFGGMRCSAPRGKGLTRRGTFRSSRLGRCGG